MVKIKGNEIEAPKITGSFERKAVQIQNHIIDTLRQIGIERDNVTMPMEKVPQKKAPASVEWWIKGRNLKELAGFGYGVYKDEEVGIMRAFMVEDLVAMRGRSVSMSNVKDPKRLMLTLRPALRLLFKYSTSAFQMMIIYLRRLLEFAPSNDMLMHYL
jgi:hypothetical protein